MSCRVLGGGSDHPPHDSTGAEMFKRFVVCFSGFIEFIGFQDGKMLDQIWEYTLFWIPQRHPFKRSYRYEGFTRK